MRTGFKNPNDNVQKIQGTPEEKTESEQASDLKKEVKEKLVERYKDLPSFDTFKDDTQLAKRNEAGEANPVFIELSDLPKYKEGGDGDITSLKKAGIPLFTFVSASLDAALAKGV